MTPPLTSPLVELRAADDDTLVVWRREGEALIRDGGGGTLVVVGVVFGDAPAHKADTWKAQRTAVTLSSRGAALWQVTAVLPRAAWIDGMPVPDATPTEAREQGLVLQLAPHDPAAESHHRRQQTRPLP
ncbi:MAG: hypothetical protein ACOCY0_04630 [Roseicyclus sp.]